MAVMKDARAFESGQIIGLSFLSFVAMLAVEAVLIYVLCLFPFKLRLPFFKKRADAFVFIFGGEAKRK